MISKGLLQTLLSLAYIISFRREHFHDFSSVQKNEFDPLYSASHIRLNSFVILHTRICFSNLYNEISSIMYTSIGPTRNVGMEKDYTVYSRPNFLVAVISTMKERHARRQGVAGGQLLPCDFALFSVCQLGVQSCVW